MAPRRPSTALQDTTYLKLIAFLALLEYALLKPWIIPADPEGRGVDFIGFVLCHAVLVWEPAPLPT